MNTLPLHNQPIILSYNNSILLSSKANCVLPIYISFIINEPKTANCQRLSEVMGISHDSVNRFLLRENLTPRDLFNEISAGIELTGGTLSVDDTVIDKRYADVSKHELNPASKALTF